MGERPDKTGMTFDEIAAKYGEEVAIKTGIAADPDTVELDEEWFKEARPASEVVPHIVESFHGTRGKQKAPTKKLLFIRLDADLAEYFRQSGKGWHTRLNDMLRRAVFGP